MVKVGKETRAEKNMRILQETKARIDAMPDDDSFYEGMFGGFLR